MSIYQQVLNYKMKFSIVIITGLFFAFNSCSTKRDDVSFILGKWREKGEDFSAENWILLKPSHWKGFGYRLEKGDTIFTEELSIFRDSTGQLIYRAMPDFVEFPVDFVIDSIWKDGFRSVNLENDYPTHIQYERNENMLRAIIWGTMSGRFLSDTLNYFLETREDSNSK